MHCTVMSELLYSPTDRHTTLDKAKYSSADVLLKEMAGVIYIGGKLQST